MIINRNINGKIKLMFQTTNQQKAGFHEDQTPSESYDFTITFWDQKRFDASFLHKAIPDSCSLIKQKANDIWLPVLNLKSDGPADHSLLKVQ